MVVKVKKTDALICVHCSDGEKLIREISYTKHDGIYQFLCGENNHFSAEAANPIHSWHVFEENPDIQFFTKVGRSFLAQKTDSPDGWRIAFINVDDIPEDFTLL